MEKKHKIFHYAGLVMALVLLVNMLYAIPLSAAETRSIMFSYPVLSTSDARVSVTLCVGYQESYDIYIGASVSNVSIMRDVISYSVGKPVISEDGRTITVSVSYELKTDGGTIVKMEYLKKSLD